MKDFSLKIDMPRNREKRKTDALVPSVVITGSQVEKMFDPLTCFFFPAAFLALDTYPMLCEVNSWKALK